MCYAKSGISNFPDFIGNPKKINENGDLQISLKLEPNQHYNFGFAGDFFQSAERWPMKNSIYLDFSTSEE